MDVPILNEMAQRFRTAIIVVTHDEETIPRFTRIYPIRDGTHRRAELGGYCRLMPTRLARRTVCKMYMPYCFSRPTVVR
jgi:ABC-type lipoprotein export system ATPase subunit